MIQNKYENKKNNRIKIILLIILIIFMLILSFFLIRICFFNNDNNDLIDTNENIDVSNIQRSIDDLCDIELIDSNKDEINRRINQIDNILNNITSEERFLLDLSKYEELIEYYDDLCNKYEIKITINNEKLGNVTGEGKYKKNSVAKLEAKAKGNAKFVGWSDDNTDNPREVIVNKNMKLQANFSNLYKISVNVNDSNMGLASGSGEYAEDSNITLEAKPNKGYEFVRWLDGSAINPRSVLVKKEETFTAIFSKTASYGYVSVNDDEAGHIDGDEQLIAGKVHTVSVDVNKGYRFVRWSDGNRDNPRSIEVVANKEYVAILEPIIYNIVWDTRGVSMASFSSSTATVKSGIGNIPSVTDTDEYKFIGWYLNSDDVTHTGNIQVSASTIPETNMTCYAVYGKKQTVYRYAKPIGQSDNLIYESSTNLTCLVPDYPEYYVMASINEEKKAVESNAGVCGVSRVDNGYHCHVYDWDGCSWVPCESHGECCCGREYIDVANTCEVTHNISCPAYYEISGWQDFTDWSINPVEEVKYSENSYEEIVKVETAEKYVYNDNQIWQG